MLLLPGPLRYVVHLLPYPLNLAVPLVVLIAMASWWWHDARDDPVLRGQPYGRVVPYPWSGRRAPVIVITAAFRVLPEHADRWLDIAGGFSRATRAEPGCLRVDWSRSADDPTEYLLVEAFRDGAASTAHVRSPHFRAASRELSPYLAEAPRVISQTVDRDDRSELGGMTAGRTA